MDDTHPNVTYDSHWISGSNSLSSQYFNSTFQYAAHLPVFLWTDHWLQCIKRRQHGSDDPLLRKRHRAVWCNFNEPRHILRLRRWCTSLNIQRQLDQTCISTTAIVVLHQQLALRDAHRYVDQPPGCVLHRFRLRKSFVAHAEHMSDINDRL